MGNRTQLKVIVLVLLGFISRGVGAVDSENRTSPVVAAAADRKIPLCGDICNETADCTTLCEVVTGGGSQFISCGDFDGNGTTPVGYEGDWCDGMTWDSCEALCPYTGSSGTSCTLGGASTDCGTFGTYAYCGDGFCSLENGEDTSNCSADCDLSGGQAAPVDENDPVLSSIVDAADEMNYVGTSSMSDLRTALGILYYYGLTDDDYSNYDESSPSDFEQGGLLYEECEASLSDEAETSEMPVACATPMFVTCPPPEATKVAVMSGIMALGSVTWGVAAAIVGAIGCPPCAALAAWIYGAAFIMNVLAELGASTAAGAAITCLAAMM